MLFNSLDFLVFLVLVFAVYWRTARNVTLSNFILLVASYVFYGWWDWRFLSLLAISSVVDFVVGARLGAEARPNVRKGYLLISLVVNLGILGFFKYFNFFVDSFAVMLTGLGVQAHLPTLRIILPVGVSFYTFQALSYTIDVYRREMEPTQDPVMFLAYVSFFPQLVAGPIERASSLLPQFLKARTFDPAQARDGLRRMLWGYVKKVVVADNLADGVDAVFVNYGQLSGWTQLLGIVFFAIQIYCDFSGYSDIAIGLAKLFGFRLMTNFARPYFSRNMAEFWRRWHISLSTWFRDYVYIPLGGSRVSGPRQVFNIFTTFVASGLWHGANWTFVVWGFLHSCFYAVGVWKRRFQGNGASDRLREPEIRDLPSIVGTFALVCVGWVFFRADSIGHAWSFLGHAVTHLNTVPNMAPGPLLLCSLVLIVEWMQRRREHPLDLLHIPVALRWCVYYSLVLGVVILADPRAKPFIYFQF